MGLLDDAKAGVSKWFEEQVAKNKAFKAAGGMVKSNPARKINPRSHTD
jgi:hypothetical protein